MHTAASETPATANWQRKYAMLGQAIESGDPEAGQAFAALFHHGTGVSSSDTSQTRRTLVQDIRAIGQALQDHDGNAAQTAFDALRQDLEAARQAYTEHHYRLMGGSSLGIQAPVSTAGEPTTTLDRVSD